jgi:hypothetical protein
MAISRREFLTGAALAELAAPAAAAQAQLPAPDSPDRGFLLVRERITPYMFEAENRQVADRTTRHSGTSVPPDSTAALRAFFAHAANADRKCIADFSGNWGISSTLTLDQPRANRTVFKGGQLFALAAMEDMLVASLNWSHIEGSLGLIGGAGYMDDSAAYTQRRARNGLRLVNNGTAHIEEIRVANVREWGVLTHDDTRVSDNIGMSIGLVRAYGCGAAPSSGAPFQVNVPFSGRTDTGGSASFLQLSVLTVADSASLVARSVIRIGGLPYYLHDKPSRTSVRVYPWLSPGVTSGTIESVHGGALMIQGGNTGAMTVHKVDAFNSGTVVWSKGLYGAAIEEVQGQFCGQCITLGSIGTVTQGALDTSWGTRIGGWHSEGNDFDILALAPTTTAEIGEPSVAGGWDKSFMLRPRYSAEFGGGFVPSGGFYNIAVTRGGQRHLAKSGAIGTTGENTVIGNERADTIPVLYGDNYTIDLVWSEDYSRLFPGRIDARCVIIGNGPNRQPSGTITVRPSEQQAASGYTVNGARSLRITALAGRAEIIAVKQSGTNNWLVSW